MQIKIIFYETDRDYVFGVFDNDTTIQETSLLKDLSIEKYDNVKWAIEGVGLSVVSYLERAIKEKQEIA